MKSFLLFYILLVFQIVVGLRVQSPSDVVKRTCDQCNKEVTKVLKCSKCKTAKYCSKGCQKAAWKTHRKECLDPKTAERCEENEFECSICSSHYVNPVTTHCQHTYCSRCLDRYLTGYNNKCPDCRSYISKLPAVNLALRGVIESKFPETLPQREAQEAEDRSSLQQMRGMFDSDLAQKVASKNLDEIEQSNNVLAKGKPMDKKKRLLKALETHRRDYEPHPPSFRTLCNILQYVIKQDTGKEAPEMWLCRHGYDCCFRRLLETYGVSHRDFDDMMESLHWDEKEDVPKTVKRATKRKLIRLVSVRDSNDADNHAKKKARAEHSDAAGPSSVNQKSKRSVISLIESSDSNDEDSQPNKKPRALERRSVSHQKSF